MSENIQNELTTEIVDNKIRLKRVIVDEMDAEEYIRNVDGMRMNLDNQLKNIDTFKNDYEIMKDRQEDAQKIRDEEIEKAKEERKKYEVK